MQVLAIAAELTRTGPRLPWSASAAVRCTRLSRAPATSERSKSRTRLGEDVATAPGSIDLDEQAGGHPLVEGVRHLVLGSAKDLREELDVDLGAEDGGHGQHVPGSLRQVDEAVT